MSNPLFQYKIHACSTNEIFLLVADVFAKVCVEIEARREKGDTALDIIVQEALSPYARFVRNLWWDAARVSSSENNNSDPVEFAATLQNLVAESWGLLSAALKLEERGLATILNAEYVSR
jgi:hypothetical protein